MLLTLVFLLLLFLSFLAGLFRIFVFWCWNHYQYYTLLNIDLTEEHSQEKTHHRYLSLTGDIIYTLFNM